MNAIATLSTSPYLPELLTGMLVNFRMAAISLAIGLALGLPISVAIAGDGAGRRLTSPLLGLMRAAPTFVVMFFLLNTIPYRVVVFGLDVTPSDPAIVALALGPYAAAYVADNGCEALRQLKAGQRVLAFLFFPGLLRGFVVLVMASSAGAAIGVNEGVSAVLREADRWPALADKLAVFGVGVFAFGLVFQAGFLPVRFMIHRLTRRSSAAGATQ